MVSSAFILLLSSIHSVFGHKCYVCGPASGKPEDLTQLRRTFPNVQIPVCSEYKHSLQSEYLLDCPGNNNGGCLTKFEDDGSIMRTCAPIGIDDCKAANGVNYCYCSGEGCNTPERRLPPADGWSPAHQPRQGHEIDFTRSGGGVPRIQDVGGGGSAVSQAYLDDDDDDAELEGSADEDWGFYYDSYYDTAFDHRQAGGGGGWNDTEPGFGDPYDYDMTELPPYMEKELEEELEKISRLPVNNHDPATREFDEIIIVEEETPLSRPGSSGGSAAAIGCSAATAALLSITLLLSNSLS